MSNAKKITTTNEHSNSIDDPGRTPVYLNAVASSAPATPIPTTGNFRSVKSSRSFVRKFFIMSFLGSFAGFAGGITLTILILQGMVDVNKDAIKAVLRFVTGQ